MKGPLDGVRGSSVLSAAVGMTQEVTCPECKRRFLRSAEWGYGSYCTWHCLREAEKKAAEKIDRRKGKKPNWRASIQAAQEQLDRCNREYAVVVKKLETELDQKKRNALCSMRSHWKSEAKNAAAWIEARKERFEQEREGETE